MNYEYDDFAKYCFYLIIWCRGNEHFIKFYKILKKYSNLLFNCKRLRYNCDNKRKEVYIMRLVELKGCTKEYAEKLKVEGIQTSHDFLEVCKTKKGRKELAAKVGIDEKEILELTNRADLARVKGIGRQYSNLLEVAGIDTVAELASRKPENLVKKLEEVNAIEKVCDRTPALTSVEDWVDQAKTLPRGIEY